MRLTSRGTLLRADAAGRLPRITQPPAGPFAERLPALAGALMRCPGARGAIVRGSVARGTEMPGISDIDLILIADGHPPIPDLSPDVELSVFAPQDLHRDPLRFLLAVFGWTLAGPDHLAALPDPTLGRHAMVHLPRLDRWSEGWRTDLDRADSPERAEICRRLMKRLVRAHFEAVMMDLGAWSRDIHPCAAAAAAGSPDHGASIWAAAELAVFPTDDRARIAAVADPLLAHLGTLRA